jgi:molecular chaperone DnaK
MSKISKSTGGLQPAWLKKLEQSSGRALHDATAKRGSVTAAVILAVDCSGSMAGDKLRQASEGALDFGRNALHSGYAVGVIQFGSHAEKLSDPVRLPGKLEDAVAQLRISGSTNMSAGIELAASLLASGAHRVICVVTDGMPNSVTDTLASASRARAQGIEIMAVGTDDADWSFLSQIVSRKELAKKVESHLLGSQIASMAKLLPQLPKPSDDNA